MASSTRDHLEDLGSLALASRFRRLADRLVAEVAQVYDRESVPFEPRWFGVFHLLTRRAPLSIREASEALGVSHTAVSQVVKELRGARLVSSTRDRSDARRRSLVLSCRGRALEDRLRGLWKVFEDAYGDLLEEADPRLLDSLLRLESALDGRALHERVRAKLGAEVA
jgi:DNA-binding MarR family transcriptional regulator